MRLRTAEVQPPPLRRDRASRLPRRWCRRGDSRGGWAAGRRRPPLDAAVRPVSTSKPEAAAIATAEGTGPTFRPQADFGRVREAKSSFLHSRSMTRRQSFQLLGQVEQQGRFTRPEARALQIGSWCPRPSSAGGSACRGGPDATRGWQLRRRSINPSPRRSRTGSSRGSSFSDCMIGWLSGLHEEHGAADWSSSSDDPWTSFAAIACSKGSPSLSAPEKLGDGTAIRTLKEPCLHRHASIAPSTKPAPSATGSPSIIAARFRRWTSSPAEALPRGGLTRANRPGRYRSPPVPLHHDAHVRRPQKIPRLSTAGPCRPSCRTLRRG